MGEVYAADDTLLGTPVALKVLRPELSVSEEVVQRFRREVRLARRVTHPNVCRLFDLFVHRPVHAEGRPPRTFVSMEFLSGETLAGRLLRDGRFEAQAALPLLEQLAAALRAAHAAGVIHRDLKPSNVMLSGQMGGPVRVVVTDFGLAVSPADDRSAWGSELVGTCHYMAPEQVAGGPITPASDVYAFGVVAYEMLTGARPFAGPTPLAVALRRLEHDPPRPRRLRPDLDARWEALLLSCLARDPAVRCADPAAVLEELRRPRGAGVRRGARARVSRLVLAGLVALVGAGAASTWSRSRRPSRAMGPGPPAAHTAHPAAWGVSPGAARAYGAGVWELMHFEPRRALEHLVEADARDPHNPVILVALAEARHDLGHEREAREAGQAAREAARALPPALRAWVDSRAAALWPPWAHVPGEPPAPLPWSGEPVEQALDAARRQLALGHAADALRVAAAGEVGASTAADGAAFALATALAAEQLDELELQRGAALRAAVTSRAGLGELAAARARLLEARAALRQGQPQVALRLLEEAERGFARGGDDGGRAEAAMALGAAWASLGALVPARVALERAEVLERRLGRPAALHDVLLAAGALALAAGDAEQARRRYGEVTVSARSGAQRGAARLGLAAVEFAAHDFERAWRLARLAERESDAPRRHDQTCVARTLAARAALRLGRTVDAPRALRLAQECLDARSGAGVRLQHAVLRAEVLGEQGRPRAARTELRDALDTLGRLSPPDQVCAAELALARAQLQAGAPAAGCASLRALEHRAAARGWWLVARQARLAAQGCGG